MDLEEQMVKIMEPSSSPEVEPLAEFTRVVFRHRLFGEELSPDVFCSLSRWCSEVDEGKAGLDNPVALFKDALLALSSELGTRPQCKVYLDRMDLICEYLMLDLPAREAFWRLTQIEVGYLEGMGEVLPGARVALSGEEWQKYLTVEGSAGAMTKHRFHADYNSPSVTKERENVGLLAEKVRAHNEQKPFDEKPDSESVVLLSP